MTNITGEEDSAAPALAPNLQRCVQSPLRINVSLRPTQIRGKMLRGVVDESHAHPDSCVRLLFARCKNAASWPRQMHTHKHDHNFCVCTHLTASTARHDTGVFVKLNSATIKMLRLVEPYIAYGCVRVGVGAPERL